MKIKNKGKVHPSPSSSSSSPSSSDGVVLAVLKLLPAAILALASVLSLEDREVLAYMITRSMKTTPISSMPAQTDSKKKSSKKPHHANKTTTTTHQTPIFDCDCFDCYRSYWFKWDSSPNRELIHQAIEAFEDHLANGERSKKNSTRGKRRGGDKLARRQAQNPIDVSLSPQNDICLTLNAPPELRESSDVPLLPESDVHLTISPEKADDVGGNDDGKVEDQALVEPNVDPPETADDMAMIVQTTAANNHKGLARKVLPDVLGLFNSRLWSLWSPNV